MKSSRVSVLAACALLAVLEGTAAAHITLVTPKPWTVATTGQKGPPPCGVTPAAKNPTTFKPGETIMVSWNETIKHPGRHRIALAEEGTTFPNPMMAMDPAPANMLLFRDGIGAKTGTGGPTAYTQMITLPNKPCASCILQVIQVMKVNPPYNSAANQDVYYQCAAIVIAGEAAPADGGAPPADAGNTTPDAGATPDTAGAAGSGGGGGSGAGGSGGGGSGGTGGRAGSGGAGGTGGKAGSGGSAGSGGEGGLDETGGSSGTGGKRSEPGGCAIGGTTPAGGALFLIAALALLARRRKR